MADFDDLHGFAPPPTRPTAGFPVEEIRRDGSTVTAEAVKETLGFRVRLALRRAAGTSTAMLVLAALLVGGTVAVTRAARGSATLDTHPGYAAPAEPAAPQAEVPESSPAAAPDRGQITSRETERKPAERKATFRFTSGGSAPVPVAAGDAGSAPRPARDRSAQAPAPRPSPTPSQSPYTPTSILMRLTHPNGAYFFTTDPSAAMEKEGYDGYVSERAALVWAERRGPTMIRLELSDDSRGFIWARERDVPSGDPVPLYAASTSRYGRYYSLDREQAAEIGPVVVYGWVARY